MIRRIVKNRGTGVEFIETSKKDWDEALMLSKADKTAPCPMPRGHQMFKHPDDYNCIRIN